MQNLPVVGHYRYIERKVTIPMLSQASCYVNSLGLIASNHVHMHNVVNDGSVYTPTEVVSNITIISSLKFRTGSCLFYYSNHN